MSGKKNAAESAKTVKTLKKDMNNSVEAAAETAREMFLQYGDKEVNMRDVFKRVEEIWTKDWDNKAEDLKDVKVYLKVEDSAAYFVINGDITGSFGL